MPPVYTEMIRKEHSLQQPSKILPEKALTILSDSEIKMHIELKFLLNN